MQDILKGLNEKQYEAVIHTQGPCLVIAGAGSGKTKVLTHKIAYLIGEKGVKPWDIIAITFTNKAANEMKERIANLVGEVAKDIWMGTFHSICVRILRRFIDRIGFDTSFIIFDTSDQRTLVKNCMKDLAIDDKLFTDRSILSEISNAKNEMLEPDQYTLRANGDFRKEKIATVYELYQKRLRENNAIDFDDIINYTIKIMMENPDILEYYTNKFQYVLVDEYQDTNKAQFTLITLFASKNGNITVVGDNDQGIYSFRGADISNILNFERDFPGTKIIKLEQNYRCTGNILKAANAVIKNNEVKYKKELWTQNEEGNLPHVYQADNEYDEGAYIVEQIEHLKREEYYKYSDFTILYRMNTQSRAIEDILRRENIPYKIIGGLKFYERKEIKDIVAYLRLIQNSNDNLSLRRIINEPKRGIGKTSLDKIEQLAIANEVSMYEIIKKSDEYGLNRVFLNSREFINSIEELKVKKVYISKQIEKSEKYNEFLNITNQKNIEVHEVVAGNRIHIEKNLYFDVLWPDHEQITRNALNNNSVVFNLYYKNFSMLFTGDIEEIAENEILNLYSSNKNILSADVLKVGHHGSKTSTTEDFLNTVNPKIAVIGVGKNNNFGHPNMNVLDRLMNLNTSIYRTDLNGEIMIDVNNTSKYKIKTKISCN